MKILVDADACPVKDEIISVAQEFHLPVIMFIDTSHDLTYTSGDIKVITVDQGRDSADFALANRTETGDIAITSDYGLASMLLAKKAYVVHPNGFALDKNNIDHLLFQRHISRKMRQQGKYGSHFKKRSREDNTIFLEYFKRLCQELCDKS